MRGTRRRSLLRTIKVLSLIGLVSYVCKTLLINSQHQRTSRSSCVQHEETKDVMQLVTGDNRTLVIPCRYTESTVQERCGQLKYDALESLPKTSVIITFHDSETVASLVRTIHSVIQRTPDELLQEIIVIDDFSQKEDLGQLFHIYVRNIFSKKVKLLRNSENLGLIRSRLRGARMSQGGVLFFMDSHSEVLPGWLEPLLFEIKKNRRSLVSSVIDWISKPDERTWVYTQSCPDVTIIFDYTMGFGWDRLPKKDRDARNDTDPIKTKSIIGAYCAIDKQFFTEIGEFDEGMEFWGGENIEFPLRVWLFDGLVITVPCSRVAHLEGKNTRNYRYQFLPIIRRNYKRLVEVWFDDYKECFYHYYPKLLALDAGDLTKRLRLKASASHDFKWYLRNVYPSLGCPIFDGLAWGPVKNAGTGLCLNLIHHENLQTSTCVAEDFAQRLYWSKLFHLREPNYIWVPLMGSDAKSQRVVKEGVLGLYQDEMASRWIHWKDGPLMEVKSQLCLEAPTGGGYVVKLRPCALPLVANQTWSFAHYTEDYFSLIARKYKNSSGGMRDIPWEAMERSVTV